MVLELSIDDLTRNKDCKLIVSIYFGCFIFILYYFKDTIQTNRNWLCWWILYFAVANNIKK